MINVQYIQDGYTHTLNIKGHANYATYGKDIVCAGVSSLVQALVGWIEENEADVVESANIEATSGGYVISCVGGDEVAAVFQMTAIGLEQISDMYPKHCFIDNIGLAD